MRIHSIFESISGEAGFFPQGSWCTFIRMQGCNLRCSWCDTPDAQSFDGGYSITVPEILAELVTRKYNRNKRVLITGGEPLAQKEELAELLVALNKSGYEAQVETNGSFLIPSWGIANWVVDYKCPSSGNENRPELNAAFRGWVRKDTTMVKFVIASTRDLNAAIDQMYILLENGYSENFIISPVHAKGGMIPATVAFLRDRNEELLNHIIFLSKCIKSSKCPS